MDSEQSAHHLRCLSYLTCCLKSIEHLYAVSPGVMNQMVHELHVTPPLKQMI